MNTRTTIALCSDTHFRYNAPNYVALDGRTQLQSASEQIQTALLEAVRKEQPDLLLHLGDWGCGGGSFNLSAEEYCQSLRKIKAAFCALPCPVHALPGNHDCPPGEDYSFFGELWGSQAGSGSTIDLPTARLVLLNSHGHSPDQLAATFPADPISGWVSDAELSRLEAALATAQDRPVILFVHQLLARWIGAHPWQALYQVDNKQAVLDLIARYGNVRAVFQGHAHLLDVQEIQIAAQPCTFVVLPSIIEYPMAWLRLDLTADNLSVQLQRLPLPDLAEISRDSGSGQAWREGQRHWSHFQIKL